MSNLFIREPLVVGSPGLCYLGKCGTRIADRILVENKSQCLTFWIV